MRSASWANGMNGMAQIPAARQWVHARARRRASDRQARRASLQVPGIFPPLFQAPHVFLTRMQCWGRFRGGAPITAVPPVCGRRGRRRERPKHVTNTTQDERGARHHPFLWAIHCGRAIPAARRRCWVAGCEIKATDVDFKPAGRRRQLPVASGYLGELIQARQQEHLAARLPRGGHHVIYPYIYI